MDATRHFRKDAALLSNGCAGARPIPGGKQGSAHIAGLILFYLYSKECYNWSCRSWHTTERVEVSGGAV